MRATGDVAGKRRGGTGLAFAALVAVLLAVSAAAVALLDDLCLKPLVRQATQAAQRDRAFQAEQAGGQYVQDRLLKLSRRCADWAANLAGPSVARATAAGTGGIPKDFVKGDIDAAWMTAPLGSVIGVWGKPPSPASGLNLDPVQVSALSHRLAPSSGDSSSGLCELGDRLAFFACKEVSDASGAPLGHVWAAQFVSAVHLIEWGLAAGGDVTLDRSPLRPGQILCAEAEPAAASAKSGGKLAIDWPLHDPGGEFLGQLHCVLPARPPESNRATVRTTVLTVVCLGLGLAILTLIGSHALVAHPMRGLLVRLDRLRAGEGTVDQLKEGLRGPSRAMAEELGRAITGLAHDSRADPMTGLANRRHFQEALEVFYNQAVRYGHPLSVMMMDVDHFKQVNDTLGHLEGDEVIRRVAKTIGRSLRGADIPARLGGDEFAVILPDTSAPQAAEIAERIRQRVAQLPAKPALGGGFSVSIGVADLLSGPVGKREDLIDLADKSLYAVKAQGRNKVLFAHGTRDRIEFCGVGA